MSITATIDEPRDDFEKKFNVPICSEALYKSVILVLANSHDLSFFRGWGTFVEIDAGTFREFEEQLATMRDEISRLHGVSDATKKYIIERFDALQSEVAVALRRRRDLVVLIG